MTFEIDAKDKLKKRFCVEHVQSSETQAGALELYYFNDETEVVFNNAGSSQLNTETEDVLFTQYIGGLLDQVQALNRCLKTVIQEAKESTNSEINESILIHGFEGTGKSLIIKHLEKAKHCKVTRLEKSTLNGGAYTAPLRQH